MYRTGLGILIFLAVAGMVFGQPVKLATATASQPFTLRGAAVNPSGVPSWPVMAGDEIVAGSGPVTLTLADGSKIALAPGARARLEMAGGKIVFRLISGEAAYDLKNFDSVVLAALNKPVKVSDLRGSYAIGAGKRAAGFWTARNMALVLGGTAAAAAGIGIAATRGPAPVSPSQ